MDGRGGDLLKLLANPTNRQILGVLAVEPQYPRRLAELVGLTEDETSRRLRAFERLGLVEGQWANVGRTVRLYRLASRGLTVRVTAEGLAVEGLGEGGAVAVGAATESPPRPARFVGREEESKALEALLEARRAVCVHGIGGVGKTTLAAHLARTSGRPVAWHTVAPSESGLLLLERLAAAIRPVAPPEAAQRLVALRGGEDGMLLADAALAAVEAAGVLLVLDRFEGAGEGAAEVAAALARRLRRGRLLLTSRVWPKELPRDAIAAMPLGGLRASGTEALLTALGARASAGEAAVLHERTLGHPLALTLLGLAAGEGGVVTPLRLEDEAGVRDFFVRDVIPQLPAAERDALLALAVLHGAFLPDEAEAVTGSRHAADTLLRLEARGLVQRADGTWRLHDLVRSFAAEATPDRRVVHARAAKVLAASGEPAKVLEALRHRSAAGDLKGAAGAVREEARTRANRFIDHGLAVPYRAVLEELERAPSLRAADRSAVAIELAALDIAAGDRVAAGTRAREAARGADASLAFALGLVRGRLARLDGRAEDAAAAFADATRAAERAGDADMLLEALVEQASFTDEAVSEVEALALFQRALEVGERASDLRLVSLAWGNAARIASRKGDPRFRALADEALRLARLAGSPRGEATVRVIHMVYHAWRGEIQEGYTHAARYAEIAESLGDPWLRTCAELDVAFLLLAEGRNEEASAKAEACLVRAKALNSAFYELAAATAAAEAHVALGRPEPALAVLADVLERAPDSWHAVAGRAWLARAAAEAALGREAAAAVAEARGRALLALAAPDPSAASHADLILATARRGAGGEP